MKLLFLPHCLKPEYQEELRKQAEKRNYEVHVVGGGSAVQKILKEREVDEVVGVACDNEIGLALDYTQVLKGKGTIIKAIQLSTDGCKNTEVNLEQVINALEN